MPSELLPAVEINPSTPVTASVIFLHGLGADGHDLSSLATEMNLPGVRFVFPHAPIRPVTINGGYRMRAWYDIVGADLTHEQDSVGVRESEQLIRALIQRELENGLSAERIVLAGFSQGGAMALHTGLRYPQPLAGILALSCYLPLAESVKAEVHGANSQTPIMMLHGTEDDIVLFAAGEHSRDMLISAGYSVTWRGYDMAHTLCTHEVKDMAGWLKTVLRV